MDRGGFLLALGVGILALSSELTMDRGAFLLPGLGCADLGLWTGFSPGLGCGGS